MRGIEVEDDAGRIDRCASNDKIPIPKAKQPIYGIIQLMKKVSCTNTVAR